MKDKILTFIIGLLVGAIITTLGFYIYQKVNNDKVPQMPNDERQMPQMVRPEDGGTPPEIPSGFGGQQPNMQDQSQMPTDGNI